MKKKISWIVMLCLILSCCVSSVGCKCIKIEEAERTPVEYTVLGQDEVPEAIQSLIEERKEKEFQLTYKSGDDLYLFKGYGRQMTGGYSIQVLELSESSNAIFFETSLLGPEKIDPGSEPSYPYIGLKIAYQEKPVQFQ